MRGESTTGWTRRGSGTASGAYPLADEAVGSRLFPTLMVILILQVVALLTHVWSAALQHQWLFLLLGTLVYPVGVTHGVGVWFGLWK